MEENKKEGNTAPKAETEKQKATPADQDQVATASESATTKVSENKQGVKPAPQNKRNALIAIGCVIAALLVAVGVYA